MVWAIICQRQKFWALGKSISVRPISFALRDPSIGSQTVHPKTVGSIASLPVLEPRFSFRGGGRLAVKSLNANVLSINCSKSFRHFLASLDDESPATETAWHCGTDRAFEWQLVVVPSAPELPASEGAQAAADASLSRAPPPAMPTAGAGG